ncbi:MAG TPA: hypothetical protein VIG24_11225 [Acidimicrobiia bacterium]
MTIRAAQISLAQNVVQRLTDASVMPQQVHIHNHEHSNSRNLYVGGGSDVDETNGHHILPTQDMVFELLPGDAIYGMTPDNGCAVTVFQSIRPI